ncbi:MAG: hypothetical protein U0930_01065 [Pirellulales bacterium]
MQYDSQEQNAMILPIPTVKNASEDSVKFFNFEAYPNFFQDLARSFPMLSPPPMASRADSKLVPNEKPLQVHKVGNFVASVVPSVDDFRRLDPLFSIAPDVWAKIPVYSDYSFVVFKFDELAGKPHPMAFEFKTRHENQIFFPTVHIHDGEVHAEEHFDHALYCQDQKLDAVVGRYTEKPDPATQWTRSQQAASKTVKIAKSHDVVDGDLLLHRKIIQGNWPNQDVFVSTSTRGGKALSATFNGLHIPSVVSLGAATSALSLAWFIRRRNQLRKKDH